MIAEMAERLRGRVADITSQLISLARDTWAKVGNPGAIIAGTVGAQSTGEAIRLAQDAADAGADFVLSLHPNYFPAAMTPEAIQGFFEDVSGGVRRAAWCPASSVL